MDSYIDCTLRNFQGQLVLKNEPSRRKDSIKIGSIQRNLRALLALNSVISISVITRLLKFSGNVAP